MGKHIKISSILTLIGSIIFFFIGIFTLSKGIIGPIHFKTKGYSSSAYLWEFAQYPVTLSLWASVELAFFVFGAVGIILSKKVKKKATTAQGVILIIIGLLSLRTIAGTFFFVGGILILLALNHDNGKKISI